jgi:hypothetical protein
LNDVAKITVRTGPPAASLVAEIFILNVSTNASSGNSNRNKKLSANVGTVDVGVYTMACSVSPSKVNPVALSVEGDCSREKEKEKKK